MPNPQEDFSLKETSPQLGGGRVSSNLTTSFDLVEQMKYLYVRVVKARDLSVKNGTNACDPYVELKLGNYKGRTQHLENRLNPEWNQVFAFSKERIQASAVEIMVKDKDFSNDEILGRVLFDVNEAPIRVPPDSPLAPEWYRLENRAGFKVRGELMLAVWMGTQADEAFSDAWHSDGAAVSSGGIDNTRSKVYLSPRLWYLRVNVIEAQDLVLRDMNRLPEVHVKASLGTWVLRSKVSQNKNVNPMWNEDLMFVAAEPFDEPLVLSVEDKKGPNKDECLGRCMIPLQHAEKRMAPSSVGSIWYNLEKLVVEGEEKKDVKFSSRIHLRISLDGGYHVLDESTHYSSDLNPTMKQLWLPSIGVLELGILNASGLLPMKSKDGRGTTDAYCVGKYGQKWVRTRTIVDSFDPKWNEQYTWEVYDPCTVITIGVFDNCHLQGGEKAGGSRDPRIGKVRIRLSTLETDRIYTHSYPLIVLQPSGLKKMGEIQLAVRFSCSSFLNMLNSYSLPMLPKMHYLQPLSVHQVDNLRQQASHIVSLRLSRAEPPLRREVVEYMLDVRSNMWSLRKGKANHERSMEILNVLFTLNKWYDEIRSWKNPLVTVMIHILFLIVVLFPELILPSTCFYLCFLGIWRYRQRPRHPPHMDIKLSHADTVNGDELDEEFDTFPTSRPGEVIRMRYDRLRIIAGMIQTLLGDLATQWERVQSLLSWRDPRATALFVVFCLISGIVLFVTPFRMLSIIVCFYVLRHPHFRINIPSIPQNFLRRLPAKTDSMI